MEVLDTPCLLLMDTQIKYPVVEHFYTLQGEGYWTGTAAYFIRLAGCDVGCFWCDVKESWEIAGHDQLTLSELISAVNSVPSNRVVITGGEPFLHNLEPLCKALSNKKLHVETSGTSPYSGNFDWICFSPKKFKKPLPQYYQIANELKIIVHNRHDLAWAEEHAALCKPDTYLYLQPEWYTPQTIEWIIEYVKQNPKWRISLQTHKYLNIP
ncbi:MAG: 7-carboxy-7-deazaguanine synthase QueE [Bacteroidia bacterium]|nr:7-carboxy-7-deazaguanine synthase QueE [Bacteroidia bacterium]MDW8159051.1 7-carboxy-7-deazaguanine synthase QueE [Bacteroidia bacterium]